MVRQAWPPGAPERGLRHGQPGNSTGTRPEKACGVTPTEVVDRAAQPRGRSGGRACRDGLRSGARAADASRVAARADTHFGRNPGAKRANAPSSANGAITGPIRSAAVQAAALCPSRVPNRSAARPSGSSASRSRAPARQIEHTGAERFQTSCGQCHPEPHKAGKAMGWNREVEKVRLNLLQGNWPAPETGHEGSRASRPRR